MPVAVFVGGPCDRQVRDVGDSRVVHVVTPEEHPGAAFTMQPDDTFIPAREMTLRTQNYVAERVTPFATYDPIGGWMPHWRRLERDRWEDPSGRVELRTCEANQPTAPTVEHHPAPPAPAPAATGAERGVYGFYDPYQHYTTAAGNYYVTINAFEQNVTNFTASMQAMGQTAHAAAEALNTFRLYMTEAAAVTVTNAWHANWEWQANTVYDNNASGAPLSPEQVEQRNRARLRRQVVARRAERRAKKLLLSVLDDLQTHQYAKTGCFTTLAADGRIFRLRTGKTAELLGVDGQPVASYCIHLVGGYRPEDTLVAQKLMLDTDPAKFEQVANITKLRARPADDRGRLRVGPEIPPERAARYLREYERETEAALRAEGIENPREWWDEVVRNATPLYALDTEQVA